MPPSVANILSMNVHCFQVSDESIDKRQTDADDECFSGGILVRPTSEAVRHFELPCISPLFLSPIITHETVSSTGLAPDYVATSHPLHFAPPKWTLPPGAHRASISAIPLSATGPGVDGPLCIQCACIVGQCRTVATKGAGK